MDKLIQSEAFWGAIGAIATALTGWFARRRKKLKDENTSLADRNAKLARFILNDFQLFNELGTIIDDIFANTSAERFVLLSATNGASDFRNVSAMYDRDDKINPGEAVRRYANVKIDTHYQGVLKSAEHNGPFRFVTSEAQDCLLKDIYRAEGVTESKVMFLRRIPMSDGNDRIFYCTVATRSPEGFTDDERVLIRTYAGSLQAIMQEWL
jgi:hypothetical protein